MIRHVSVMTFKEGTDIDAITRALDLLVDRVPGAVSHAYSRDLGLRAGNAEFALTFDFPDEDTYKAWDTHPEHERIRKEFIVPHLASITRCQTSMIMPAIRPGGSSMTKGPLFSMSISVMMYGVV